MSQDLISRSSDLKRLRDEGLQVEFRDGFLLVHGIPYVNSESKIKYGVLVSVLTLAGNKTVKPEDHIINFIGEYPCNKDGSPIKQIQHQSERKTLKDDIIIDHSFSNKPPDGYPDYYAKFKRYIEVISAPAKSLDPAVTEKNFNTITTHEDESVFNYFDSNASRAKILNLVSKLESQRIAIIGLGGTGSYVLDFVAKTPVCEIHLYDGDQFLQHNAFRAPGAPTLEMLNEKKNKALYFKDLYSPMRRNIFAHEKFISEENINEFSEMDFVFICIDTGPVKATIINKLIEYEKSFADVGMGVYMIEESLLGMLRTTTSTKDARAHIAKRLSTAETGDDEYSTNIQIAELNAFNASIAVIQWKKLSGFYQDLRKDHNFTYSINTGLFNREDAT